MLPLACLLSFWKQIIMLNGRIIFSEVYNLHLHQDFLEFLVLLFVLANPGKCKKRDKKSKHDELPVVKSKA